MPPLLLNGKHHLADDLTDPRVTRPKQVLVRGAEADGFGPALMPPIRAAQPMAPTSDTPHKIAQRRFKYLSSKFGEFKPLWNASDTIGFKFVNDKGNRQHGLVTGMFGERGRLILIRNNWKTRLRRHVPVWRERLAKREAAGAAVFFSWKWYQKNGQPFECLTPLEQACARTYAMQVGRLPAKAIAGMTSAIPSGASERDAALTVFQRTVRQRATELSKRSRACAEIIPSQTTPGGIALADGLEGRLSYSRSYTSKAARATTRAFHITRHLHSLSAAERPLDAKRMAVIHTLAHHAEPVRIGALANGFMSVKEPLGFPKPISGAPTPPAEMREWLGYLAVVRSRLEALASNARYFTAEEGPLVLRFLPCDVDNPFAIKLIGGPVGCFRLARASDPQERDVHGLPIDSAASTFASLNRHTSNLYEDMKGIGAAPSAWTRPPGASQTVYLTTALEAFEQMYEAFKEEVLNVAFRPMANQGSASSGASRPTSIQPAASASSRRVGSTSSGESSLTDIEQDIREPLRPPREPSPDYSLTSDDGSVKSKSLRARLEGLLSKPSRARSQATPSQSSPGPLQPAGSETTTQPIYATIKRDGPKRPSLPLPPSIGDREMPVVPIEKTEVRPAAAVCRPPEPPVNNALGLFTHQQHHALEALIEELINEKLPQLNTFGTPHSLPRIQDSRIAGSPSPTSTAGVHAKIQPLGDSGVGTAAGSGSDASPPPPMSTISVVTGRRSNFKSPGLAKPPQESTQHQLQAQAQRFVFPPPQLSRGSIESRKSVDALQRLQLHELLLTRETVLQAQQDRLQEVSELVEQLMTARQRLLALQPLQRNNAERLLAHSQRGTNPDYSPEERTTLEWVPSTVHELLRMKAGVLVDLQHVEYCLERVRSDLRGVQAQHDLAPQIDGRSMFSVNF
ncbi:MAG: hypothetical protein ACRYGG_18115 [Janthinobacterium lividum]